MEDGGGNVLHRPGLPPIAGIHGGDLPPVEVQIEHAGDFAGRLHPQCQQPVILLGGDRFHSGEGACLECGGTLLLILAQVPAQELGDLQNTFRPVQLEKRLCPILPHTECGVLPGCLRLRLCRSILRIYTGADLLLYLIGHQLRIQVDQHLLHPFLHSGALLLQHRGEGVHLIFIEPKLQLYIATHTASSFP